MFLFLYQFVENCLYLWSVYQFMWLKKGCREGRGDKKRILQVNTIVTILVTIPCGYVKKESYMWIQIQILHVHYSPVTFLLPLGIKGVNSGNITYD